MMTPESMAADTKLKTENGAALLAEVFNRLEVGQKNSFAPDVAKRIVEFLVENGYRLAFDRWYLQAPPAKIEMPIRRKRALPVYMEEV